MERRVTHLGGLPHLPGVPHLHVKRPLILKWLCNIYQSLDVHHEIFFSISRTTISFATIEAYLESFPNCGAGKLSSVCLS